MRVSNKNSVCSQFLAIELQKLRSMRQFKNSLYCMQCKCFASKCVSNMGTEANVTILKNDPPLKIILTIITWHCSCKSLTELE